MNTSPELVEVIDAVANLERETTWVCSQDVADWIGKEITPTEQLVQDGVMFGFFRPSRIGSARYVQLTEEGRRL